MTLWLPALDYARSYRAVVDGLMHRIDRPGCVEELGLSRGQIAGLRYHGGLDVRPAAGEATCPWLVVALKAAAAAPGSLDMRQWQQPPARVRRPVDATEDLLLYRRAPGR
jgi:hypothetical protein